MSDKTLEEMIEASMHEFVTDAEVWRAIAAQCDRNRDYYCGLLDEIALNFPTEAYISDDGSVQKDPLRAKMPQLVKALTEKVHVLELTIRSKQ